MECVVKLDSLKDVLVMLDLDEYIVRPEIEAALLRASGTELM